MPHHNIGMIVNTTIQVGKVRISIWKQYLIYLKIHGFNLFLQVYLIWSPPEPGSKVCELCERFLYKTFWFLKKNFAWKQMISRKPNRGNA